MVRLNRIKALVVDLVVVAFLTFVVCTLVALVLPIPTLADPRLARVAVAIAFLLDWLYHALLESSPNGATLGKALWRLRVSGPDGERLSFWRSTLRHLLRPVGLPALLHPDPAGPDLALHDRLSGARLTHVATARLPLS